MQFEDKYKCDVQCAKCDVQCAKCDFQCAKCEVRGANYLTISLFHCFTTENRFIQLTAKAQRAQRIKTLRSLRLCGEKTSLLVKNSPHIIIPLEMKSAIVWRSHLLALCHVGISYSDYLF